jgi:hypothetical protein
MSATAKATPAPSSRPRVSSKVRSASGVVKKSGWEKFCAPAYRPKEPPVTLKQPAGSSPLKHTPLPYCAPMSRAP